MSVLLPAPFSPTRASTSPGRTCRFTRCSARVAPKRFDTPRISSRAVLENDFKLIMSHARGAENAEKILDPKSSAFTAPLRESLNWSELIDSHLFQSNEFSNL